MASGILGLGSSGSVDLSSELLTKLKEEYGKIFGIQPRNFTGIIQ